MHDRLSAESGRRRSTADRWDDALATVHVIRISPSACSLTCGPLSRYTPSMNDRALLDDLIAKLDEMEEQLSMAHLETTENSLLRSRIRHLSILAHYVLGKLEDLAKFESLPPKADHQTGPEHGSQP